MFYILRIARSVLECGGKQRATPLSNRVSPAKREWAFKKSIRRKLQNQYQALVIDFDGIYCSRMSSSVAWPHAPIHQLAHQGTYFVTARTYRSEHHFRGAERLSVLHRGLLRLASDFGWKLEAWAVFSNHYHFVGHSPVAERDASGLPVMLSLLHEKTAKWANTLDRAPQRKIWFNYRETRLTYQKSYFARLNYTHQNAVKHRLVSAAHLYPWCSASWFERTASAAQVKSIYRFRVDRLNLDDEVEVAPEW